MNKYYVFARYRLPDYMRPDNCNALWSGQEPAAHSLEEQGGETCPWLITITLALVFCLVGCASPIGVKKVGMRKAYQEINANILNGEGFSDETKIVLRRFDLLERFKKDSAATITFIHKKATQDTRRDLRFALVELHRKTLEMPSVPKLPITAFLRVSPAVRSGWLIPTIAWKI